MSDKTTRAAIELPDYAAERSALRLRNLAGRTVTDRSWYSIRNQAENVTTIHVYDQIGRYGITAQDFVRDLSDITAAHLRVHLNTEGGEVFDGISIFNALRSYSGHVTTIVDGLAASIGSVIMQAGDVRLVAPNSTVMIHNASGIPPDGEADDLRALADILDQASDNIAALYAHRSGIDAATWRNRMRGTGATRGTWYTAEQAVEAGLADDIQGKTPDVAPRNINNQDAPVEPIDLGSLIRAAMRKVH